MREVFLGGGRTMKGWLSCVALFLIFLAIPSQAGEHYLSYRVQRGYYSREIPVQGWSNMMLSMTPPEGVAPIQDAVSEKPYYGLLPCGNRLVVLDQSSPDLDRYDLLRLDANGDGLLGENETFRFGEGSAGQDNMLIVRFVVEGEGGSNEQTIRFLVSGINAGGGGDKAFLSYMNQGYWRGRAKFGEKEYTVALHDTNGDGLYGGSGDVLDSMFIDVSGDGRFPDEATAGETAAIGPYVFVDGKYWGLQVSPDGSSLKINEPTVATGTLNPDEADVTLVVEGAPGRFTLSRGSDEQPFLLPVGEYMVVGAEVRKRDAQGDMWVLAAPNALGTSEVATFEILDGQAAAVKVGPPLTAVAQNYESGNTQGYFTLRISGEDGLIYQIYKGARRSLPPAPGLLIKAKEGDWERRFSFSYG
jgi:hypothetical protein